MLTALHIKGMSNTVADMESRTVRDHTDWKLNPSIFTRINQIFDALEVDLFVSRPTHQLPCYFSWRPDPLAEAMDAFQQDWGHLAGFVNLPWCNTGRVQSQVMEQETQLILVAPVWKGQPWYPVLLSILWASIAGSTRVDPPTSRVAYLREKFSDCCLSEEASSLLLASWRTKSSQSYDSHFH